MKLQVIVRDSRKRGCSDQMDRGFRRAFEVGWLLFLVFVCVDAALESRLSTEWMVQL